MQGWLRLWIVLTLAIWTAGIAHFFIQYDYRPSPPFVMSRFEICHAFYVSELEALFDSPARRPPTSGNTAEACETNNHMYAEARAWHWRIFLHWWGRMWAYWLAPFALGMLLIGGLWVRRGFSR